jgi:hypothetical protein
MATKRLTDFEMDDPLTPETLAETSGARVTLIARLVRLGLLETVGGATSEPLAPRRRAPATDAAATTRSRSQFHRRVSRPRSGRTNGRDETRTERGAAECRRLTNPRW